MWILVLKGLKQAIEAHTATAILLSWVEYRELPITIDSPTSPTPPWMGY